MKQTTEFSMFSDSVGATKNAPLSTRVVPKGNIKKVNGANSVRTPFRTPFPYSDNGTRIIDTRKFGAKNVVEQQLPEKITATYDFDYNILYVDSVIRKKFRLEKQSKIQEMQKQLQKLQGSLEYQTSYINRRIAIDEISRIRAGIAELESDACRKNYEKLAAPLIEKYKSLRGLSAASTFGDDERDVCDLDDISRERLVIIEEYLDLAQGYLPLNVVRVNRISSDICPGCGMSLAGVESANGGCLICPNEDCQTVSDVIITSKCGKEERQAYTSTRCEDDSVDNFIKALDRYQGQQQFKYYNDESKTKSDLESELDAYFVGAGRPTGKEIREMTKTDARGRKGDTDHKMLLDALSVIGRTQNYADVNIIGHMYWDWPLPIVSDIETIMDHYNKTQMVFRQIPPNERDRCSSLGTQYRLWRHLQLVGHECYVDEFKIAENWESQITHDKLWKIMCDGANDPTIFYIP